MSVRLVRLLCIALIGTCLSTSAFAKTKHRTKAPAVPKGPTLVWRGDVTTARGVVGDVATTWEKAGHGHIELQSFNTASGLDAVAKGTADLAGAARGSDNSAADSSLSFTPVAWDGLVMITHPSNPVSNLTLKQLHDIYYGKITNWSDVGGNNEPIDLVAVASPGDGVEYSLRRLLFGRGNQPVAAPRLYVNTSKLEEGIALDTKGLGVTTLSGVSGNSKVKLIKINGTAPTVANIADGSYVLFTPLYLVTNPSSPNAAKAQEFIDFMSTDPAKAALRRHAVLPFDDGAALVALDSSRRAKILAEVGARAVAEPSAPIAAPRATYAARAAVAPTSERTLAAKQAVEKSKEDKAAADAAAAAALAEKASLKNVSGNATTVDDAAAHGKDFAKVTSNASVAETSAKAASASAAGTYKVAKGDTLSSIARKHSVDVADLRAWNDLKGDQLKLGQTLRLSAR